MSVIAENDLNFNGHGRVKVLLLITLDAFLKTQAFGWVLFCTECLIGLAQLFKQ